MSFRGIAVRASLISVGKESACNAGDPGSIPGLGRSLGEGNVNPHIKKQRHYFAYKCMYSKRYDFSSSHV